MNDKIENIKKVYSKPTLEEIGDVSELTKGENQYGDDTVTGGVLSLPPTAG